MEVVGQCPGDKRKHSDVLSAEAHSIATPVPSEPGDSEQLDEKNYEKKERDKQDRHTEAKFRECLAKEIGRSSSARSTPY